MKLNLGTHGRVSALIVVMAVLTMVAVSYIMVTADNDPMADGKISDENNTINADPIGFAAPYNENNETENIAAFGARSLITITIETNIPGLTGFDYSVGSDGWKAVGQTNKFTVDPNTTFKIRSPQSFGGSIRPVAWEGSELGEFDLSVVGGVTKNETYTMICRDISKTGFVHLIADPLTLTPEFSVDQGGKLKGFTDGTGMCYVVELRKPFTITAETSFISGNKYWSMTGWEDENGVALPSNTIGGVNVDNSFYVAVYDGQIIPPKYYSITATADPGAHISPSGVIYVLRGEDQRFNFSAVEGYTISSVIVDGIPLSEEQIARGYYTFTNVVINHTIVVHNTRANLILEVNIASGEGYVEYKINNGSFVRYSSTVNLPENADVTVRAIAMDGFVFKEWKREASTYKDAEISFTDVAASLYLNVYFEEENSSEFPWWIVIVVALIIAGLFLFWFIFFYRRSYEVVKIESSATIEGKDKARRKSKYTFTVVGGSAGSVSYRVGEEGEWKTLVPNEDGSYTIPRDDVIDKITIEAR